MTLKNAALALFLCAHVAIAEPSCPWELLATLMHEQTTPLEFRDPTSTRFWRLYKNDDGFHSWLSQKPKSYFEKNLGLKVISDWEAERQSFEGKSYQPMTYDLNGKEAFALKACCADVVTDAMSKWGIKKGEQTTGYFEMTAQLRKGDKVRMADGKEFVLGEFLGRGNATHVYAIEGDLEHAIKLPILSLRGRTENKHDTPIDVSTELAIARGYLKDFVENSKSLGDIDHVQVKADEAYSYAIVTRIHGDQNAQEFVIDLIRRAFPSANISLKDTTSNFQTFRHKLQASQEMRAFAIRLLRNEPELYRRLTTLGGRDCSYEGGIKAGIEYMLYKMRSVATERELEMLDAYLSLPYKGKDMYPPIPFIVLKCGTQIDSSRPWFVGNSMRQIVWDVKNAKWVLADWDELDLMFFGK